MYSKFFGLKDSPFSIAPDPRYLYMSERHREGLAHLLYGVSGHGGFVLLTGEVGTGKTTVCRCFLDQVPDNTDIAFIIHPKLTGRELLASICDELHIAYTRGASTKVLVDMINQHLLNAHAAGRNTVVIVDEAQNLSIEVLEQLRLLTNLETSEKKLLQIVLLGQPELVELLQRPELRQLSQRITARYHLQSLSREDVRAYVYYRLSIAGLKREIFTPGALAALAKLSKGVPRLINLICDRAMLGAYSRHREVIDKKILKQAAKEVLGETGMRRSIFQADWLMKGLLTGATAGIVMLAMLSLWHFRATAPAATAVAPPVQAEQSEPVSETGAGADDTVPAGATNAASGTLANATVIAPINAATGVGTTADTAVAAAALTNTTTAATAMAATVDDIFQRALENLPSNTKASAFRNLFRRWAVEYDPAVQPSACEYAETVGLRCMHRQGSWRSVIKLGRPFIMSLRSPSGEEFFVTVQQISDDNFAKIDLGDQAMTVKIAALDALWAGEYSLLWRRPPYPGAVIRANGSQEEQDWLAERLTRIEAMRSGNVLPPEQRIVLRETGVSLEDRVRRFQADMGLLPDGIAGAHTLIQMSTLLDSDAPRLQSGHNQVQLGGAN